MSLASACRAEIIEIHVWFEEWFRAELPQTDAEFARVERALAGDFYLVSPRGTVDTRESLLALIRKAYGGRKSDFRIWIEGFDVRQETADWCLATYEEWQEFRPDSNGDSDGELQTTVRLASALFRANNNAPNGVEWFHLHETWRAEQSK